jgi:hypothetical protein
MKVAFLKGVGKLCFQLTPMTIPISNHKIPAYNKLTKTSTKNSLLNRASLLGIALSTIHVVD